MTAVDDLTVPGPRPESVVPPALVLLDPVLDGLLAEQIPETVEPNCTEAELVDRIARLESLQHQIAALQSAAIDDFARRHVASRIASGVVDPEKLERSISGQIALACRVSPAEGGKRMRMARDLRSGHDHVHALFTAGELSAYKTATIVAATSDLDAAERAEVDRRLATHDIAHMGVGRIRTLARALAAEVAPEKFTARCRAAGKERRVSLRPAPDGMTDLIAHLPLEQGVACYAALAKAVNDAAVSPEPVTRGRGQIMADTLVERVTGQATAPDVAVEVQVVVPVEALIDKDSPLPAQIPGHGPVPLDILATGNGRRTPAPTSHPGRDRDRRGLAATPVHRPARRMDQGPGRIPVQRALLRRPDPTSRPHPPKGRPWGVGVRQRQRCVRAPQLPARDARMARGENTRGRSDDHTDRTHLHRAHMAYGRSPWPRTAGVDRLRRRPWPRPQASGSSRPSRSRSSRAPVVVTTTERRSRPRVTHDRSNMLRHRAAPTRPARW